jgi:hypothetical protein
MGQFLAQNRRASTFICNSLWPARPCGRHSDAGFLPLHNGFRKTKWVWLSKICYMNASSPDSGVWFPHWADVLARVRLKELERRAYRLAIVEYLGFCKRSRQRATVASARVFMAEVEARRRLGRLQLATWKAGLNWFFKMARSAPSGGAPGETVITETLNTDPVAKPCVRGKEPPLAAMDLGGPTWERALVRVLR